MNLIYHPLDHLYLSNFMVLDKEGMSVEDGYKMVKEWVNVT
jgi:hypothetical protein